MTNNHSWSIWALAAGAVVELMGGCTTPPRVAPIDRGSTVAFVVVGSKPTTVTHAVHDTTVGHDSGSGAKSGAAAGALSGLLCGPAFFICSPIGALAGAGVGAAAGATVGLAEALPRDKVALLIDRLERLQQSLDPVLELRTDVLARAGRHWELTDDTSMRVVTLEVQSLFLRADRNENIALVMEVVVSQRTGEGAGSSRSAPPKRYSVVSQGSSLASWLDERSDLPETQLRSACQQIATQVVSELAFN
jgi:hypothetical protein